MTDIRLSEHFMLSEFTRSSTAERLGICNELDPFYPTHKDIIANLKRICEEILEPLRAFAGQPIIIGSGFRCPALNKAVGGVKNSQHMTGEACDIRLPRTPYVDWGDNLAHTDMSVAYRWLDFLEHHTDFDQLILEHSHGEYWIHVSCKSDRSRNRHQVIHFLLK